MEEVLAIVAVVAVVVVVDVAVDVAVVIYGLTPCLAAVYVYEVYFTVNN